MIATGFPGELAITVTELFRQGTFSLSELTHLHTRALKKTRVLTQSQIHTHIYVFPKYVQASSSRPNTSSLLPQFTVPLSGLFEGNGKERSESERGFGSETIRKERKSEKGGKGRKREWKEERSKLRLGWHFYWSLGIWYPTTADITIPSRPIPHTTVVLVPCHPTSRSQPSTLVRQISLGSPTSSSQYELLLQDLPLLFYDGNDT